MKAIYIITALIFCFNVSNARTVSVPTDVHYDKAKKSSKVVTHCPFGHDQIFHAPKTHSVSGKKLGIHIFCRTCNYFMVGSGETQQWRFHGDENKHPLKSSSLIEKMILLNKGKKYNLYQEISPNGQKLNESFSCVESVNPEELLKSYQNYLDQLNIKYDLIADSLPYSSPILVGYLEPEVGFIVNASGPFENKTSSVSVWVDYKHTRWFPTSPTSQ